ncbi:exocyst complex component 6, partial [Phenoliferia sp. Uapishka_3]
MLSSLPSSRSAIRESVTRSLKAWMYEAREASQSVGKGALEAMEARGRRWAARKRREMSVGLTKINGPIELGVSERHECTFTFLEFSICMLCEGFEGEMTDDGFVFIHLTDNVLDNDTVRIDFKPLYQCIHIYDTLDAREELQQSYQADRRAQAFLLLSQTASLTPFSLPALSALLEEIVGFFLIESHVLKTTTNSFRSEQDVEDLWDGMCERVVRIVDEGLGGCEDPEVFLGTKFKVLTFVQTLEIVLDDDHQQMVVNDPEEFEKVVSVSWLPTVGEWSALELQAPGFPLALPFSQTYPLCCIDIRSFTEQYYQFSEGFAEHHRDIDDVLRKALDNLLIKQVSENIQRRLQMINNLSQLSQIVVNVLFFQTACSDLETLLVTLRYVLPHHQVETKLTRARFKKKPHRATQRGGTIHLDSLASFQQTLTLTQNRIVTNVSQKSDSFFEEAQYNWEEREGPPPNAEPSPYLMDLTDFLSTVMMSVLIQLPEFSKDVVYKGALAHCAGVLMSYLIDRQPARISDAALAWVSKDVKWLKAHITKLGDERLTEVFMELEQTLALLIVAPNLLDFLNTEMRAAHYSRIQTRKLQVIVGKLMAWYNTSAGSRVDSRRRLNMEELAKVLARS